MLGKDGVEVEHGFHFGRGKDPTTPEGHSQRKFKFPECSIKPATSLKPQQRKKFIVNLSNFNVHYKRFNIYKRTIVFPNPVHQENGNLLFGTLRHFLILLNALGGFFYLHLLSKFSKSSYK